MIEFFIGLIVGCFLGIMIMTLMSVGGKDD